MLLKNQWVNGEVGKYLKTNENGNNFPNSIGCSKISSQREVSSNTSLSQKTTKTKKINHLTLQLKQLEKEQKTLKLAEGKKLERSEQK